MLEREGRRALFHIERCVSLCPSSSGGELASLMSAQDSIKAFLSSPNITTRRESFDNYAYPQSFDSVYFLC